VIALHASHDVEFDQIKIELTGRFYYYSAGPDSAWAACDGWPMPVESIETRMLEFDVQRFSRKCAKTDRELQPGETFYSVLLPDGGDVVRCDFSTDAWDGPPENAIGWWQSEVPDPKSRKVHWAPTDVMLHYFIQLSELDDSQDMRYVLALLMIRKRILRLDDTEKDDDGNEVLHVYCSKNESEYEVEVVTPNAERIDAIQAEIAELLFK